MTKSWLLPCHSAFIPNLVSNKQSTIDKTSDNMPSIEPTALHNLIVCHECDLLHRVHPLRYGERATCSRCGAALYAEKRNSFEHTIMLALTSLILFTVANAFPFMTFELHGRVQESLLSTGVKEFFERGMWTLGVLVFCASILFPALKILGMLYVLVPLECNRRPWKAALVFRMVEQCQTWAMMDVYLLGVIVAVVKLADLAILAPGVAILRWIDHCPGCGRLRS